ncbi:hypothetical protein [Pedobacter rhizosphaerae]|uniref:Uncharacterized protein n=1 Tax=Pedobacter rhizosphaerae TaxID=390241 RepID=A0A1H9LIF3_9SPHI|nr:hypothetical protein [Pedobacter rhizosphaerae]SER11158.1 hypothetical protein SAMN04488023_104160 [Pedobacter rhizosphaerae]
MPLKKAHITVSTRKPKQLKTVKVVPGGIAVVASAVKGKVKKSSVVSGAAKKSFADMVKQKEVIALAFQKGEAVAQIKGVRFVKPF